ncbi:hypothetical protein JTB14_020250 [Gonioctena quinquepunctata]|nr:hypothetical protein JTB14_020250 [Gonioctena quinquepunctata]
MSLRKVLTQKELKAVSEEGVDELEIEGHEAGTFELHVPDSHNADGREAEQDEWSSSDEEDLASKRKRLAPRSSHKVLSKTRWVNGKIEYSHSAISRESADGECIQYELAGKTPLKIFLFFLDDEILQLGS